jgi:hypothetical protein
MALIIDDHLLVSRILMFSVYIRDEAQHGNPPNIPDTILATDTHNTS